MESHISQARRWRERAAELRAVADAMDDKVAKADLGRVAAKWDKMAADAEAKANARKDDHEPGQPQG